MPDLRVMVDGVVCTIEWRYYQIGGGLGMMLWSPDGEPYGTATKNLHPTMPHDANCVFLDENNMPGITEVLVKAGIAERTGWAAQSGFCTYPEVRIIADHPSVADVK